MEEAPASSEAVKLESGSEAPVNAERSENRGKTQKAEAAKPPKNSPLKSLCWALLSSNEFLYVN